MAWEGVRNYGARNALRQMAVGDRCLLQHTGKAAAVVATLRVVRAPYAEAAQFDPDGPCVPAQKRSAGRAPQRRAAQRAGREAAVRALKVTPAQRTSRAELPCFLACRAAQVL